MLLVMRDDGEEKAQEKNDTREEARYIINVFIVGQYILFVIVCCIILWRK